MLTRSTQVGWIILAVAVVACGGGEATVHAQSSFLERLEATVREQLSNPNTGDANAVGATSEEELPSPPPATGDKNPPATTSILESGRGTTLPSPTAIPADQAGSATAAPRSGRIYLGLEAEELIGGGIGVRVSKVTENSPAWKGGIRIDDRISAVNGFAITNLDSMVEQLGKTAPGESVRFLVNRDGRNLQLVAVLMDAGLAASIAGEPLAIGQRPSRGGSAPGDGPSPVDEGAAWLGLSFNDLTDEFRRQFGLTVFRGAAVTAVAQQSPAAKVGIMAGDAITSVAGLPIESGRDLMVWLDTARAGQSVQIGYQRGTLPRTATVTLEVTPASRTASRPAATSPRRPGDNASGPPAAPTLDAPSTSPLELTVPPPVDLSQPAPTRSSDVVPNTIPMAKIPGPSSSAENASPEGDSAGDFAAEIAKLQSEVSRLRSELEKANQRLESTQNRLKQILEGLGKE